ncbi:unnamed protein product, partial [marine sediment metagenome]
EKYILHNKANIQKWLPFKQDLSHLLNEYDLKNTCVIHFRGADYKSMHYFLTEDYYKFSVRRMKEKYGNLRFLIVTDDVPAAEKHLPDMEIASLDEAGAFYLINNAEYLIIPNSSFSWWAAWLNTKIKRTLAPKFWHGFHVNKIWFPFDIQTKNLNYIDKNGNLEYKILL